MSKVGQWIGGFKGFMGEVRTELTKCTWPTRPELMESTVIVVISCLILSAYVGLSDGVLMALLNIIIR